MVVYDEEGKAVGEEIFDLNRAESAGTIKVFELLGPLLQTLSDGGVLLVDELDSRLHPLLTRYLIRLFHGEDNRCAQLVFSTHFPEVLDEPEIRRDEIWLVEKDRFGASNLFSVAMERSPCSRRSRTDGTNDACHK